MIKRITIEKIYWFLLIVLLGIWGSLNMLNMEHEKFSTDESPLIKLSFGLMFILSSVYLLFNGKHLHIDRVGVYLFCVVVYMAIALIAILPNTAVLLSYFYQPMTMLIGFLLYLCMNSVAHRSDELQNFVASWIIVAILIIAYVYLVNWRFVNQTDEYHMGSAYWSLFLLPVLLYSPKKWLHYVGIVLVATMLFFSFKRGGILALFLGLFAYLVVKEIFIGKRIKTLFYFVVAIIALISIFLIVDNAMGSIISERFFSIKEDGGSGRDVVWATTWNMIQNSDLEYLLFGHGFSTVAQASPLSLPAHNDFLESLYDFGICGSLFYLGLHISLIKQILRNIRSRNHFAAIMAFAYTFFLVLSMASHVLIYPWFAFMGLSWGIGTANEQKIGSL